MKTEDMIKYAALAIGAYLLYKWMTEPSAAATKQLTDGTGTGAGAGAGAGAGNPATPPPPTTNRVPTEAEILNAALLESEAPKTGNLMFSGHAWNWYRAVAGKQAGWSEEEVARRADIDLGPEMNNSMTAVQYHALLKANGLSGLGYAQSWGGGVRVH